MSRYHVQMLANMKENMALLEDDIEGCVEALVKDDKLRPNNVPAAGGADEEEEEVGVAYLGEIDVDDDEEEPMDDEIEDIVDGILDPLAHRLEPKTEFGVNRPRVEPRR